ncbi:DUF4347 domain-containing protein [Scytonema sp. UIC 10036]|uniref:DUF4347 domain-containing protein n=1 Tax=Scytonema sp. UIC 10036 TaxID=2304196 RepID=UPI0012DA4115|nr:DUF4347 domain-containing protein [Scytonema sp. UIC 10036]MUG94706.1 DUF4347 domain-containing protein [Scytonema sp. UIC 10036]
MEENKINTSQALNEKTHFASISNLELDPYNIGQTTQVQTPGTLAVSLDLSPTVSEVPRFVEQGIWSSEAVAPIDSTISTRAHGVDSLTNLMPDDVLVGANGIFKGERIHEIVFVDANVKGYENLVKQFQPNVEVVLLDAGSDGIAQISEVLGQYRQLQAVHIISHGESGRLQLGTAALSQETLNHYQEALKAWSQSFTLNADILIYGCNVAATQAGQDFVKQLGVLTGTDIAASDNLTGNAANGGDWKLEVATGTIEEDSLNFGSEFQGVLGNVAINNEELKFTDSNEQINFLKVSFDSTNKKLVIEDIKAPINISGNGLTQISANKIQADTNLFSTVTINTGASHDFVELGGLSFSKKMSLLIDGEEGQDTVISNLNSSINTLDGNLIVRAEKIDVGSNTSINTGTGKILLEAKSEESTISAVGFVTSNTEINLQGATLKGGDINITANSTSKARFLESDSLISTTLRFFKTDIEGFIGSYRKTDAFAKVNVNNGTLIDGSSVTLTASSNSDAKSAPMGVILGLAAGIANAETKVKIADGVTINTKGFLEIKSNSDISLDVFANTNTQLKNPAALAITLAYGESNVLTTTEINSGAKLNVGGDLKVSAETKRALSVEGLGGAYDDGSVGLTAAVGVFDLKTTASLGGEATVKGSTHITSESTLAKNEKGEYEENKVAAEVGVAEAQPFARDVTRLVGTGAEKLYGWLKNKKAEAPSDSRSEGSGTTNEIGFGGAVAVSVFKEDATASISEGAKVKSDRIVSVEANVADKPQVQSVSGVESGKESNENQVKNAVSIAVNIGDFSHTAKAYIGSAAEVDAKGALITQEDIAKLSEEKKAKLFDAAKAKLTPDESTEVKIIKLLQPQIAELTPVEIILNVGEIKELNSQIKLIEKDLILKKSNFTPETIATLIQQILLAKKIANFTPEKAKLTAEEITKFIDIEIKLIEQKIAALTPQEITKLLEPGENKLTVQSKFEIPSLFAPWGAGGEDKTWWDALKNIGGNILDILSQDAFSSWAQATAVGTKVGVAGSVNIISMDNQSLAYIDHDAKINQNLNYRSDNQNVSVNALNTQETMLHMSGNYDPNATITNAAQLIVPKLGGAKLKTATAGAGVASQFLFFKNTTKAKIEDGVKLYAKKLEVNATQETNSVDLVASGSAAPAVGSYGAAVTFSLVNQKDITHAQVASGAAIAGDSVNVTANNDITHFNLIGGFIKAENVGIGASVGINEIERETLALIEDDSDTPSSKTSSIEVTGDLNLKANSTGKVTVVGLAGAIASSSKANPQPSTDTPPQPTSTLTKDILPSNTNSTPPQTSEASQSNTNSTPPQTSEASQSNTNSTPPQTSEVSQKAEGKYGIGISGDVAWNTITDKVKARINDKGTFKADRVRLSSENTTDIVALSGSVAFVNNSSSDKTSVGLAGSFSRTKLEGDTQSTITGANLQVNELDITAYRKGELSSFSAGGSGTVGEKGYAVAGSVSINLIKNNTVVLLDSAQVKGNNALRLHAADKANLLAIAGAVSLGGKAGVGAAIAYNKTENNTQARVKKSTLTNQALSLTATNTGEINAITGSVGAGKTVGAAGTVSVNFITNNVNADITDDSQVNKVTTVSLSAQATGNISSIAGAIGAANKGAFGGALAYNDINNKVETILDKSSISNASSLSLDAKSTGKIETISAGIAGSDKVAIAGSVSLNYINNKVRANITNNANVTTTGAISLKAEDTSTIRSLAGALAVADKVAVGASIAYNDIGNTVVASVDNATVLSMRGEVTLNAESNATIETISAGGAGADTFALGGSISINDINNQVESYFDKATIAAKGLALTAQDTSKIKSLAGQLQGAEKTAIGAAIAYNSIRNGIQALIKNQSKATAQNGNIDLKATSKPNIASLSAGISAAGKAAIAGSVSWNKIQNSINAQIQDSTATAGIPYGDCNITLLAQEAPSDLQLQELPSDVLPLMERYSILSAAGQIGVAGTAAVGAAASYNELSSTIQAGTNKSTLTATGNIDVRAFSSSDIATVAAGGSIGGTAGVAGSVNVNLLNNNLQATFINSTVTAEGSVLLFANTTNELDIYAGTLSGAGKVGVGGTVVTNIFKNQTEAAVKDNSTVTARGNTRIFNVTNADGTGTTESLQGLAVIATSKETVDTWTGTASGSGQVGVSLTASIATVEDKTQAYIQNSQVNSDLATVNPGAKVKVLAFNLTDLDVKAGSVSVAVNDKVSVGAGATADVAVIANTTAAFIDNAKVNARGGVDVTSYTQERLNAIVISGALALSGKGVAIAVAGSVKVIKLQNTNNAYISNSTVNSQGTLNVIADDTVLLGIQDDNSKGGIIGGAASVGLTVGAGFGVGATVIVNLLENKTKAYITNSTANAVSKLQVKANSKEDIITTAAVGSVGVVGLAGATIVNSIKTTTQAFIEEVAGGNTRINQDAGFDTISEVQVTAQDTVSINDTSGGVSAGLVGVGASVDVTSIQNTTTAYIGDGVEVSTRRNITVEAKATQSVESKVVAAAAGAGAIQGAISILNLGSANSEDAEKALGRVDQSINSQVSDNQASNALGNSSLANQAKTILSDKVSSISVGEVFDRNAKISQGTTAFIGANARITANDNIIVNAEHITTVKMTSGAAGIGGISIGGSVAIANINNNTAAYVGQGANLTAQDINITANSKAQDLTVKAIAGGAGGVALGAAVALIDSKNNARAYTTINTNINSDRNLKIQAETTSNLTAEGKGNQYGGAAVGLVWGQAGESGTTEALLLGNIRAGNLTVVGQSNNTIQADATASTGGIFSGSGAIAKAKVTPIVKAWVGDDDQNTADNITLSGGANIWALATGTINANANGSSAGGVSCGLSEADATWQPTIEASIGNNTTFSAKESVIVRALNNLDRSLNPNGSIASKATSSSGSLIGSLVGSSTKTTVLSKITAKIGDNALLTTGVDIDIQAQSFNKTDADSNGDALGAFLASGSATAGSIITNTTVVQIGTASRLTAGRTIKLMSATDNRDGIISALTSPKTLVSGGSTSVLHGLMNNNSVKLGDDSQLKAAQLVSLQALNRTNLEASAAQKVKGLIGMNLGLSTMNVTSNTTAEVGERVSINTDKFSLQAKDNGSSLKNNSYAETSGAQANSNAQTLTNANFNATARVQDNAIIFGRNSVNIEAIQDDVLSDTNAKLNLSTWFDIIKTAVAQNNLTVLSTAETDSTSAVTTNSFNQNSSARNLPNDYTGRGYIDSEIPLKGTEKRNNINYRNAQVGLADIQIKPTSSLPSINAQALQNAIAQIGIGGTITFADSLKNQVIQVGNIVINKDLTIDGSQQNITLRGNNNNRIFLIDDGKSDRQRNVTLKGLTIGNGRADFGGAISNAENLTLENVTFTNNQATKNGGAISNSRTGTISINNSRFANNSAVGVGGAISNLGTLNIVNSTFEFNKATTHGGALENSNMLAKLTVADSTFANNTADNQGGGIFNNGNASIVRSTLSSNTAKQFGGGISNKGILSLSNSTLSGNQATVSGGGLYNQTGAINAKINNSTVTLNQSATNSGSGIADAGYGVFLTSSIVSGNANNDDFSGAPGFKGQLQSRGNNLIGGTNAVPSLNSQATDKLGITDPKLAPLANNGGLTQTHMPLPDSLAINNGKNSDNLSTDQSGGSRSKMGGVDVGAVEYSVTITKLEANRTQLDESQPTLTSRITVMLDKPAPATGLRIAYTLEGSAELDKDYRILGPQPGVITFGAGKTEAAFEIQILDDKEFEPSETIILRLNASGDYTLASNVVPLNLNLFGDDTEPAKEVKTAGITLTGDSRRSAQPQAVVQADTATTQPQAMVLTDSAIDDGKEIILPKEDKLIGTNGNDTLIGGFDDDIMQGLQGNDRLEGNYGNDLLIGGADDDNLLGGSGQDTLKGEAGDDELKGGDGADRLEGGIGIDVLYGDAGNDDLQGNDGNDYLLGDDGADLLEGGAGKDVLRGGRGEDSFLFASPDSGMDRILDFNALEGDRIQILASGFGIENGDLSGFKFENGTLFYQEKPLVLIEKFRETALDFSIKAHLELVTERQVKAEATETPFTIDASTLAPITRPTSDTNNTALPTTNTTGINLLEQIRSRGYIKVGLVLGDPGFAVEKDGRLSGFSVDWGRALAAALFNDPNAVEFVIQDFRSGFFNVASGVVDVASIGATHNLARDTSLNLDFSPVVLYDSQGVIVRADRNIKTLLDLKGMTIGTLADSTSTQNLQNYLGRLGLPFVGRTFANTDELFAAYERGEIDAVSIDSTLLKGRIPTLSNPNGHKILDGELSKEPLALVLPENQSEWADVIRWVTYATTQAEEFGINSANVDDFIVNSTDSAIRRFLGVEGNLGEALGLDKDFVVDVIKAVGNYDELYKRHFGELDRTRNHLWTNDGLLYSLPFSGSTNVEANLINNDNRNQLQEIKQRGVLKVGLTGDSAGFGLKQPDGSYKGFDIDLVRALSAALFGNVNQIEFVHQKFEDSFTNVANGVVDITADSITHNLMRDALLGVDFSPTYMYTGQGIMVRNSSGINNLPSLNGRIVGVSSGTTSEQNLQDALAKFGANAIIRTFATAEDLFAAYERGEIDAVSIDLAILNSRISTLSNPGSHRLLNDVLSKEPLSLVLDENQSDWADVVRWVVNALVQAEEFGITSQNIDEFIATSKDVDIRRFLGLEGTLGQDLGLPNDFVVKVIKAVGNYGEVYNRHFGSNTLPRGENQLSRNFGLQYALPFSGTAITPPPPVPPVEPPVEPPVVLPIEPPVVSPVVLPIEPQPEILPLVLIKNPQGENLLEINGDVSKATLKFTLSGKHLERETIHEIGVFVVDDTQGRVNGLLPSDPGYLQAALQRGKVIFSLIPDNFVSDPSRILQGLNSPLLAFYLVQKGSTDDVLNGSGHRVLFGSMAGANGLSVLQINDLGSGNFELAFEDLLGDTARDIVLKVNLTDEPMPIGTSLQGQREREIFDLSDLKGLQVPVLFPIIESEAAYNNTVGFYRLEDSQGTVRDPMTGQLFKPGDPGYTKAAARNSKAYGVSFDRNSRGLQINLEGGYLYAPFIIANSTLEKLLDDDNTNDPAVYFIYARANPDRVDHIRLLGDNTWGFEDMPDGGDLDFNDMVIRLTVPETFTSMLASLAKGLEPEFENPQAAASPSQTTAITPQNLESAELNQPNSQTANSQNTGTQTTNNLDDQSNDRAPASEIQSAAENATATGLTTNTQTQETPTYDSKRGYGEIDAQKAIALAAVGAPTSVASTTSTVQKSSDEPLNQPDVADGQQNYTGQGVVVAVIDVGIDRKNRNLAGSLWVNTDEISDNGIDDDGNGFTDDVQGWDFVDDDPDASPDKEDWHGTHVAGIISAANDSDAVTGIAPSAKIMPLRVLNQSTGGTEDDIAAAICYAVDNGAQIINLSLGFPVFNGEPEQIRAALQYAKAQGVMVVAAAGNREDQVTEPLFPARFAQERLVIAVGAADENGNLAIFSNPAGSEESVFVLAPGVGINSLGLEEKTLESNGTSMAAAYVTGVIALMKEANPHLSPDEIMNILTSTSKM